MIIAGVALFTSCSNKFTNYNSRYTLSIPPGWEQVHKGSDTTIPDFFADFINSSSVDILLCEDRPDQNIGFIYILSYDSFINIKNLYSDEGSSKQLFDEIMTRFGNCHFINKQMEKIGHISATTFRYQFSVNNTAFIYRITFLSGSLSSTQAIYSISESSEQQNAEKAVDRIINSFKKF